MASTLVDTRYGKVQGVRERGVSIWRGVPYARAPVGPLRFRPPEPPLPWTGIRDATRFGPAAVQITDHVFVQDVPAAQSEDCLHLNIWSPDADGMRRPVLVWIHGGAFVFGSGQNPWYDGTAFAAQGDIVVVTINYRLGPFGFLHLVEAGGGAYAASGNAGLLDQVAALRWVRDNIAAFGGDPARVTIAGESAGSMSVGALMTMPAASGLFGQAIFESGIPAFLDAEAAAQSARHVLDTLGIGRDEVGKLQTVPAADILAAAQTFPKGSGLRLWPVLDGNSVPHSFWDALASGATDHIPVLAGSNHDELMLWGALDPTWRQLDAQAMVARFEAEWGTISPPIREYYLADKAGEDLFVALMRIGTLRVFQFPTWKMAAVHSVRAPTWLYRFDWESRAFGGVLKACHALEIPFVFNTLAAPGVTEVTGDIPTRAAVAHRMHGYWTGFVRTGRPQGDGLPDWPSYDADRRATMLFNVQTRVEQDPDAEERRLWEETIGP